MKAVYPLKDNCIFEYFCLSGLRFLGVCWAIGAHYTPPPRHNHQSQHSQQIDQQGQEESETQILQFAETSNKSFSSICNIPISGPWPGLCGLSSGFRFLLLRAAIGYNLGIQRYILYRDVNNDLFGVSEALLICTSDCLIDINLFCERQSLKFHVLVLIIKFFNFIESFYGRHQHGLAWDMNILGKIWINLKFSNNIIGSLADFNIATTEAPATRPTTHTNTSVGFTVTQNRPSFVPPFSRLRKNAWK